MINVHPTFLHEFLDVACAQRVRHIPAHPHENDFFREMGTLKTDRHRLSPSCISVGPRGRAYLKSPPMKTCDKTVSPTTSLSCATQICSRRIAAFRTQATKGSGVLRSRKPLWSAILHPLFVSSL